MLTTTNRPLNEPQIISGAGVTPGKPELGQMYQTGGNVYIFLQGVANTVAGMWVTYTNVGATALLAADAKGPVAIALAAVNATTMGGWYQIFGRALGRVLTGLAANANLYATATAGVADDAAVAGDRIYGAISRGTSDGTQNVAVQIYYPYVDDINTDYTG